MPIALRPRCVEGSMILHCVSVFKVARAIECVEAGARESGVAVNLLEYSRWLPSLAILLSPTNHSIDNQLGDRSHGAQPSVHPA